MPRVSRVLTDSWPLLAAAVVVGLVLVTARLRRGASAFAAFRISIAEVMLGAWVVGLVGLTVLGGDPYGTRQLDLDLLRDLRWALKGPGAPEFAQAFNNALLFVPLGVLAPMRWPAIRKARRVAGLAALVALTVESLQFARGGRVASASDVVLAILGGAVGYALFAIAAALLGRVAASRADPPPA